VVVEARTLEQQHWRACLNLHLAGELIGSDERTDLAAASNYRYAQLPGQRGVK
jgi:hypothetical protein